MNNPYAPYTGDYRKITTDDVVSAARALELSKKTTQEVIKTQNQHQLIDAFASKVIVEACQRELDNRWIEGGKT